MKLVQQAALKKQQGDKNKEHQLRRDITYFDSQIKLYQRILDNDNNYAWNAYYREGGMPIYEYKSSDQDLSNEKQNYDLALKVYNKGKANDIADNNEMVKSWLSLRKKRIDAMQKLHALMSKS